MNKKLINIFLLIFVAICFAVFIVLINFHVLLFNPVFVNDLLEKCNSSDAVEPTEKLINFFQGKENLPEVFTNEKEITHLNDVKKVINWSTIMLFVLFFVSLFYFSFSKALNRRRLLFFASVFIFIFAFLLFVLPFTPLFEMFHNLFFAQGTWQFSADRILIQFYPVCFFQFFFQKIIINSLISAFIIFLLVFLVKKL